MSTQYYLKNNQYVLSKRDYSNDYSNEKSLLIDMTMSGHYLADYPKFEFDYKKLSRYPSHSDVIELEKYIKKKFNINRSVVIGSGSNGILQNIVKILFKNGGNLITPYLTFDQVEFAVSAMNGITKRVLMKDYKIDFDNILNSIDDDTRMIYICNPNNPTGIIESPISIIDFAKKISIPIIVDESAIEFSIADSILNHDFPKNLYVVKTFSKVYGLANLRIGYLICNEEFKKLYNKKITINEVSGVSCSIALRMLKSSKYLDNIENINKEKEFLINELELIDIHCLPSYSNTLFIKNSISNNFMQNLIKNNISVVPITYQDETKHFRIAIQNHDINANFIEELKKMKEVKK